MMFHLVLILAPLALLVLFLGLVSLEERRGSRLVLSGRRYRLDRKAERAAFVIRHVDWGAFLSDVVRSSADRILHDAAHSTLMAVRFAERQLTGAVRTLRARREAPLFPARDADKPSRLESTIDYVKKTVHRSKKQNVDMMRTRERE